MTAFVKFDPWAAIAAVRGEDKPKTLAAHLKTENLDAENSPTGKLARPFVNWVRPRPGRAAGS
jgi:hypothetical protein